MISGVVLLACLSLLTDQVSTVMLFADNQTLCPWSNPYIVLHEYGYRDDNIPRDLFQYSPSLMHEDSVLHLVDHLKQFKLVGSGGNAQVYGGILQSSGESVVIKTLTDGEFEELLHEARIMAYLQESPYVPRLFGLIPTGPTIHDISMVGEYIENSTSVEELLVLGHRLSECVWISILQQTTAALLELHKKFVLFNDLHTNNLIVSWTKSQPHVHIIDFGHASFRRGKSYNSALESTNEFDFLSPEVWFTVSTPASDVFSLGKALEAVNRYINNSQLTIIARKCLSINPKDRPLLSNIKDFIDDLANTRCLSFETETVVNSEPVSSPSEPVTNHIFEDVSLPLISWQSMKIVKADNHHVWLRYSSQTHTVLAQYKPTNMTVVVKMFVNASFNSIRHEASVNYIMNDTGYVPAFLGVSESGTSLDSMCIIQEYFAEGQTLNDIVETLTALDFSIKIVLALELVEALRQFHEKGLLVNNFKIDNILIDFIDSYPVIKFIDLGKCSLHQGFLLGSKEDMLQEIEYLAPEVKQNRLTSQASDVYSLGVVLRHIFGANPEMEMSQVIFLCLDASPAVRPSASEVKASILNIMSTFIENEL